ncbi:PTS transporter subunit EIIB, partial [Clostridioides difficile]|uniref:PTS transporter subunit EIIB n=1 Tax=Clostridioides difficile TaxID=1496 RepID=UPI003F8D62D5
GGYENIVTLNNCMTRLRLEVKDATILNDDNIKKTGAKGVIKLLQLFTMFYQDMP